ncbi:transcription termination factor NusA [Anaeroglobus sp. AF13-6AC]|uniref:transcription termination factor NusA n=1 Tax=Anaeroglobus sp. AF13-6AC TaxID=2997918 RepID=UPI0022E73A3D|nr:transcription termination factor NusA [Anaeroglobus sp. AF13-6AC]
MNKELLSAIEYLSKEKGVTADVICDSLEAVLITAYKKEYDGNPNATVRLDRLTGDYSIVSPKTVVAEVADEENEISVEDARAIDKGYEEGDEILVDVTPKNFGRIAAQAAKQVMIQRLREAERNIVYDEFYGRTDDIITGIIQRIEQKNVYIDLGKAEAVLPYSEQIPTEEYTVGQRIKCYVVEVRNSPKGAQIQLSRTHPGLLKRLFELEVPEIYDGVVELHSVAREPGKRSKIAVYSRDPNVDCVGACVGPKGARVQNIVMELQNEKIDIVKWDEDPAVYIANALSPAQVVSVTIDEGAKSSVVVVPDYQLSLAIGKAGQNARLAAKLTNWKIDIKSESQAEDGDVATGDDDILAEFDAVDNEATSMPVEDEV